MTDEIKESFWDYKVVIRFLRKTNEAEIRSIFAKLNTNSVVLNDQELRNARYMGKFKLLAERLADNPFFQKVGLFTPREVRRMLDIEYVSELLVLEIFGITNKKDLLESSYANYDEDFPLETEYEEDFNIVINLIRSLINNETKALFKTKSNFYSLFGSSLEFYKRTSNTQYINPKKVSEALFEIINCAKINKFDDDKPEIEAYFDAVGRAASDKSRRVKRQDILVKSIYETEGI